MKNKQITLKNKMSNSKSNILKTTLDVKYLNTPTERQIDKVNL